MREQLDLALGRPGAVQLLVCCAVAAVVLFLPLARLLGWRPGWTLLALLSLAPILVFTVPVEAPGWQDGAVYRVGGYVRSYLHAATFHAELDAPTAPDERTANLLLFVPLGFFGALATRRAVSTAVAGAALSFGIEGWQAVSGVRDATAADWLYNSGGALIGAAAGLVVLGLIRLTPTAPPATSPAPPLEPASPPAWAAPPLEPTLEFPAHEDETTVNLSPVHSRNGGTRVGVPPW
ncbi:VanZ family protein [Nucisporomicrobium flavum]|uniref:VanZ family protein n=1 Tax=Nucisporomicrobium flavum TaxID=2785915 RepID=UPI0018F5CF3C|nr:VanZ family protein [Nucisporomicrobium flavum]